MQQNKRTMKVCSKLYLDWQNAYILKTTKKSHSKCKIHSKKPRHSHNNKQNECSKQVVPKNQSKLERSISESDYPCAPAFKKQKDPSILIENSPRSKNRKVDKLKTEANDEKSDGFPHEYYHVEGKRVINCKYNEQLERQNSQLRIQNKILNEYFEYFEQKKQKRSMSSKKDIERFPSFADRLLKKSNQFIKTKNEHQKNKNNVEYQHSIKLQNIETSYYPKQRLEKTNEGF